MMKENNGSSDIDQLFETAIENRNNGALQEAVKGLLKIISTYSNDSKIYVVHAVLGGVYADLNEFTNSLASFKKAAELNPKSELASLGLYLSYVELDRDEDAIRELIRYLTHYPANLYKHTLVELLEGLKEGYMTNFESEISALALKNDVSIDGYQPSH
jgi:tetratricopeptide (TPR) repeat protein